MKKLADSSTQQVILIPYYFCSLPMYCFTPEREEEWNSSYYERILVGAISFYKKFGVGE